jgi:hypothetical protein
MTITYKITPKGRDNQDSPGGHLGRMMKAIAAKKEMTLDELVAIVKRHSDGEPRSITSWYCSQALNMGWLKREVKETVKSVAAGK